MAVSSLVDVCRFNPTTGGTTDWTFSSAVTGYQSPSAAGVSNGAQYSYRAESSDLSQWEVGTGTYNTGTGVLSRTVVLFNSAGTTSKISFSAAPQVALVALAEDIVRSIAGLSGAFTLGSGLNNSTNTLQVAAGVPLRLVQAVDTTNRSVSSTSYAASGSVSSSFSPVASANQLRIQVSGILGVSTSLGVFVTLFRSINGAAYTDITPVGVGEMQSTVITANVNSSPLNIDFLDSPATTQSVQYQIYMKSSSAGTVYLGRRGSDTVLNSPTIISVTEIKG